MPSCLQMCGSTGTERNRTALRRLLWTIAATERKIVNSEVQHYYQPRSIQVITVRNRRDIIIKLPYRPNA